MQRKTEGWLKKINREFYQNQANNFSATRRQPWPGWEKAWKVVSQHLDQPRLRVLDVGCGNGRFAEFVSSKINQSVEYVGLDASTELIKIAKRKVKQKGYRFEVVDISEQSWTKTLDGKQFDLIAVFGVMHHVPTNEARKQMITTLGQLLTDNGVLVVSWWQFAGLPRFKNRMLSNNEVAQLAGTRVDFEPGDYLLRWGNQPGLLRYCHSFSDQEINHLVLRSSLRLKQKYWADGKNSKLNCYTIWET